MTVLVLLCGVLFVAVIFALENVEKWKREAGRLQRELDLSDDKWRAKVARLEKDSN